MQDRPFVLLGVNNDAERAAIQKVVKDKQLCWRSWWDSDRRIAQQWHVQAWPSFYLIDHEGVIRSVGLNAGELDAAVEQLVAAAEHAQKK